jgi:hypothetical protein
VKRVLDARIAVGVNVAVLPEYVTAPLTVAAPGPVKVKVAAVIVAGFMASLNVAEMTAVTGTAVAPLSGTVETAVGGGAVVKVHI